jgi:hypothetical protein
VETESQGTISMVVVIVCKDDAARSVPWDTDYRRSYRWITIKMTVAMDYFFQ